MGLENGSNWVSIYYTYDQAGQLTQVDDRRTGVNTVWQYSYDNGGNMVRKSVSVNGGTATVTTYQHTDSGWYDLLTKVGNTAITHGAPARRKSRREASISAPQAMGSIWCPAT